MTIVDITPDTVELNLPGTTKYLNVLGTVVDEVLLRAGDIATDDLRYAVKLAIHEACTNIAQHAYAGQDDGRLEITIVLYPNKLDVTLFDTGQAFDLSAQPDPELGTPQVHGFGLFLMDQLLDEVSYYPGPSRNRWHLVKYLNL